MKSKITEPTQIMTLIRLFILQRCDTQPMFVLAVKCNFLPVRYFRNKKAIYTPGSVTDGRGHQEKGSIMAFGKMKAKDDREKK